MLKVISSHKYLVSLSAFTFITIAILLFIPPIPQDPGYHNFADNRSLFGINNLINVISNIPFIVVGCLGLFVILVRRKACFVTPVERWPYVALFIGSILTGVGSGYYHLNPDNSTLLWDRLPMCIIFMSYFSAMFMERISRRMGLLLFFPLVIIGILGVLYWAFSEMQGNGDLRLYGWVQFYPICMIVLMLLLFPPTYSGTSYILQSFGWYAIAKAGEFFDYGVYVLTLHTVSGHTIKHLAAALSIYLVVRYLMYRRPEAK